ncbi:MAG: acyltransferase [Pseudomonadota bacterium]
MSPADPAPQRLEQLTAVRFFAAYGVLLSHYAGLLGLPEGTRFLTDFFSAGVALFFVLSGFVLAYTYEARFARAGTGALWGFAVARFARLMPVYWLCLVSLLALYLVFGFGLSQGGGADYAHKALSFLVNALAMQAWVPDMQMQQYWNAPGWSISSEFFFYACFPLMLRWRILDGRRATFAVLWIAMAIVFFAYLLVVQTILRSQGQGWESAGPLLAYGRRLPLMGLFCFAVGIHLARARERLQPAISSGWMAAATAVVLAIAWRMGHNDLPGILGIFIGAGTFFLVYTPYFYLLLAWLLRPDIGRALCHPALVLLGNASYALYLLHWLPLGVLTIVPAESARVWGGVAALGLPLLSIAVFRWFEDPLRRAIRQRLRKGGGVAHATAIAASTTRNDTFS